MAITQNRPFTFNYRNFVLIGLIALASCNDPEILPDASLELSDFETVIPSDLQSGASIGRITITSNQNNLTYTLLSVSPAGAISINSITGQLKVKDAELVRHENNEVITARVEVGNENIRKEANILINIDQLNEYDYEIIDYFTDIALGFEFGNASKITRRWETDINIYVMGSKPDYLMTELDLIIAELNSLIKTDITIRIVENEIDANFLIYLGSQEGYTALYPGLAPLVNSNWGLFSIYWNSNQELNFAHMYVDINRANTLEQRHLLREELTQSLGLGKDSEKYSTSIFQSSFSTKTTSYDPIDKELIRLLYHPDMKIGLSENAVTNVLRDILISEK